MRQFQRLIKITEITTITTRSFASSPMRTYLVASSIGNGGGNESVNLIRKFFTLANKNNDNSKRHKPSLLTIFSGEGVTSTRFKFKNENYPNVLPRCYYNEDTNASSVYDPYPSIIHLIHFA